MSTEADRLKQQAADKAVEMVESGMVVGLGTGSTAILAVRRIAEFFRDGRLKDIVGVSTSKRTGDEALELGLPLADLEEQPRIDLTIDGADEVDDRLNLIKGGGGAHLWEKMVAQASDREVIIVDESKLSPTLGTTWAVPVEVIPYAWPVQAAYLESLGGKPKLRLGDDGQPFVTRWQNYIIDADFGPIRDPEGLAIKLSERAGIVEHGLFLGIATEVVVAGQDGVRVLKADR